MRKEKGVIWKKRIVFSQKAERALESTGSITAGTTPSTVRLARGLSTLTEQPPRLLVLFVVFGFSSPPFSTVLSTPVHKVAINEGKKLNEKITMRDARPPMCRWPSKRKKKGRTRAKERKRERSALTSTASRLSAQITPQCGQFWWQRRRSAFVPGR